MNSNDKNRSNSTSGGGCSNANSNRVYSKCGRNTVFQLQATIIKYVRNACKSSCFQFGYSSKIEVCTHVYIFVGFLGKGDKFVN